MRFGATTWVLLLACLGQGAWVLQQWMGFRSGGPQPPQQAAAGKAAASSVRAPNPPPMAPLAGYGEIVERPLFAQTRRPPPEPEPQQRVAKRPTGNLKLEGTALAPGGQVAVLRNTRTSRLHRVLIGQRVDGWQLDQVGPGHVALSQGVQKLKLALERPDGTSVR